MRFPNASRPRMNIHRRHALVQWWVVWYDVDIGNVVSPRDETQVEDLHEGVGFAAALLIHRAQPFLARPAEEGKPLETSRHEVVPPAK